MKTNWVNIDNIVEETHEEGCREWQVDYAPELGEYRVSEFLNNHFQNEVTFHEAKRESPEGFYLLTRLEYLRNSQTDMVNLDNVLDVVANWLLENNLIDEVDY